MISESIIEFAAWLNNDQHVGGYDCLLCEDHRRKLAGVGVRGVATELVEHLVNVHGGRVERDGRFKVDETDAGARLWFNGDKPFLSFDVPIATR